MTLKARKSSHRNNRVGWARVKTGQSRGWGLPRKWPSLNKKTMNGLFNKKTLALGIISLIVLGILYAIPDDPLFHSYQSDQTSKSFFSTDHRQCISPCQGVIFVGSQQNIYLEQFDTNDASGWTLICSSYTGTFNGVGGQKAISLNSNSTCAARAISHQALDFSTAANREFVYRLEFLLAGVGTFPGTWGIFITRNSTSISTGGQGYNPDTDPNVILEEKFAFGPGGNGAQIRNRIQHDATKSLSSEGLPATCPLNEIIQDEYMCIPSGAGTGWSQSHYQYVDTVLNYTGNSNGPNSGSYMEQNIVGTCSPCATARQLDQPYLTLSTGKYYVGIWSDVNNAAVGIGPVFLAMATPWTPPANAPAIDTGGFFGPLIRALISVGVFVLQSVETYLGFLAIVIKIGLNAIGSFFGWGNIGDTFVNTVTGIVTTIVAAAAAVTNFLANLVARGLDLLNIATTFSSVFFTGIQKFLSEMSTITGGIVTIFSKLFLYGGAFYFLYDLILYFQLTGDAGFEGIGTWIGFNKWAAFSVFGLLTRILNALINAFDWLLSHIPTIGAKMPENGFPGIPQLSAGDFPGLRIPTGHVAKLREGDPAAFFLWAVGGFLILPFYLGSAISPLAGLTAAVGCNPTTCFNNMLTTVGYPFAGLFIIIFVGVTITEILHGITDVGGQRIVIQNKLPAGFRRFEKGAKGEFSFGTGKFAQFKKGHAKQSRNKAVERQETISREQAYENRHGSSVFE